MSKRTELTGRTEILAAIYNSKHLPSAVLGENGDEDEGTQPYCLHSLRDGDFTKFDTFINMYKDKQGFAQTFDTDEKVKAWLTPFFEDYHDTNHTCMGCYQTENDHKIRDNAEACLKTTEDCA